MPGGRSIERLQDGESPPWATWAALALIAFGGSLLYGSSLAAALPGWDLWRGALWLTFSAGSGWLLLGPTLILLTKRRPFSLAHGCLWAMAVGEAVLALGATLNFLGHRAMANPVAINVGVVAVSNVAMAAVLAAQLGRIGVPRRTTLLAWILALDGGGALAFWIFYRLLLGGHS